jgi:serine/threonine protein kinase
MVEGGPSSSAGSSGDELPTLQESGPAVPELPRYGRYQLLERIGRGGMAEVFLAVMEGTQGFRRRCVVKRIRPEKARSAYYTQMFVDEARITAALHHPNIVQVYEFGEIGELLFLTMEYLDGKNLASVLDSFQARGRLMTPMVAAHITLEIARGLHHAHTATDGDGRPLRVIHRDMSPTNVMLLRTGEVKILDFGVASAERAIKHGSTTTGRVKGKLPYMAPEQHSGRPLDCRADLFAVGALLWEMLTGEILLSDAHARGRGLRVMEGAAPPPSELRPDVPPALDAVVLRCLQPQPQARYPSAAALADALADVMGGTRIDTTEVARLVEEVSRSHDQPTPRRPVHLSALRPMLLDRTPPHALDSGLFNLGDDQPSPALDGVLPNTLAVADPANALVDADPAEAIADAVSRETMDVMPVAERAPDEQSLSSAEESVRERRKLMAVAVALGLALAGLLALVVHSHRPPASSLPPLRRTSTVVESASMPHRSPAMRDLDRPATASAIQPTLGLAVPVRATGSTGGSASRPAKRTASPARRSVRKQLRRAPTR